MNKNLEQTFQEICLRQERILAAQADIDEKIDQQKKRVVLAIVLQVALVVSLVCTWIHHFIS